MDEEKSFEERKAEDDVKQAAEKQASDEILAPYRAISLDDLKKSDKDLLKQMGALSDQRLLIAHVMSEKVVD